MTWTGRGNFPCDGKCDVSKLPLQPHENPIQINILNGDHFTHMTFYKNGETLVEYNTTAVLQNPEPATAWYYGNDVLVYIHTCGNWAILRVDPESEPYVYDNPESEPYVYDNPEFEFEFEGYISFGLDVVGAATDRVYEPDPNFSTAPPTIPLPSTGIALIGALILCFLIKKLKS